MMPGMPQAHRLAELMEERRLDLGLRWNDVAAESGMSVEGLRAMRRDGAIPRPLNQRGIEKALQWRRGSIQRILGGEDPVPADAEVPASVTEHLAEVYREIERQDDGDDVPVLTEDEMRILATFVKMIRTRKAERERDEGRRGA